MRVFVTLQSSARGLLCAVIGVDLDFFFMLSKGPFFVWAPYGVRITSIATMIIIQQRAYGLHHAHILSLEKNPGFTFSCSTGGLQVDD